MDASIREKLVQHFSHSKEKTYPKGKILTMAHQEPVGVSFLLDGIVEQYDITPAGNKVSVNLFKPPSFFPMSWAINNVPNAYFFEAVTDVTVREATAESTVAFLRANPEVTFDLLSRVYRGTDALLKRLVLAASDLAANRLIFELLIETYRFGTELAPGKWSVTVKQSALAARSGLARETVSRELHKLQRDGLIVLSPHTVTFEIKRLEALLDISV